MSITSNEVSGEVDINMLLVNSKKRSSSRHFSKHFLPVICSVRPETLIADEVFNFNIEAEEIDLLRGL